MEKTILIDEKYIPFKSTGATPLRYQAQFQRSFFKDLINIVDGGLKKDAAGEFAIEVEDISNINMDTFYNIAWVFAKTADKTIPSPEDLPLSLTFF